MFSRRKQERFSRQQCLPQEADMPMSGRRDVVVVGQPAAPNGDIARGRDGEKRVEEIERPGVSPEFQGRLTPVRSAANAHVLVLFFSFRLCRRIFSIPKSHHVNV